MSEPPKDGEVDSQKPTSGNKDDLAVKPRSSTGMFEASYAFMYINNNFIEDEEYVGDVECEASEADMPACVSGNDSGIETPTKDDLATPEPEAEDALLDAVEDLFGEFDWNLPTDDEVNI